MSKRKFLWVARGYLLPSIALKVQDELGHDVVFYAAKKDAKGKDYDIKDTYEGMGLEIITDEKKARPFLEDKERIKVVEDTLLTHITTPLIKAGQPVLCGYKEIEKWETDRDKGMDVCKRIEAWNDKYTNGSYNIHVLDQQEFSDFDQAMQFVEQNPGRWVIKEAGDSDVRDLTYKGELESGMDVIARLEHFKSKGLGGEKKIHFFLQKRNKGIEIACSVFFNGQDFLNFTEVDFEHQPLLSGDRGPNTGEFMNQGWGLEKDDNQLYQTIFKPLVPYLKSKGYHGFLNLNGMIDERGYHPFEWTVRMAGCPWTTQLYEMLYGKYDYGEFLFDLAYGRNSKISWNEGYCVGVRVDVPPTIFKGISASYLKKQLEEDKKLQPELISLLSNDPEKFTKRLEEEFTNFHESSYEMPVIIDNYHPEKARHFHWNEVKNLQVIYKDGVPYGQIQPTGTTIAYITETGSKPKTVDRRLDYIIESMAGLSLIDRDDFDEPIEENLAKLESWGWKLAPKTTS
jgi:hypothetical protein